VATRQGLQVADARPRSRDRLWPRSAGRRRPGTAGSRLMEVRGSRRDQVDPAVPLPETLASTIRVPPTNNGCAHRRLELCDQARSQRARRPMRRRRCPRLMGPHGRRRTSRPPRSGPFGAGGGGGGAGPGSGLVGVPSPAAAAAGPGDRESALAAGAAPPRNTGRMDRATVRTRGCYRSARVVSRFSRCTTWRAAAPDAGARRFGPTLAIASNSSARGPERWRRGQRRLGVLDRHCRSRSADAP